MPANFTCRANSCPPNLSYGNFRICVDHEAKGAVARAVEKNPNAIYGYPIAIENEVIATCNPQLKRETVQDNLFTTDANYLYLNSAIEAHQKAARDAHADKESEERRKKEALDAPRLKAEKAEQDKVLQDYAACLIRNAKILSLNSNEPAEVIVKASLPSCSKERQVVVDVRRRHNNDFSEEFMAGVEETFKKHLLLEVIETRALPAAPPPPPPASTKHETPI